MKLRLLLIPMLLFIGAAVFIPINLWQSSSSVLWLLLIPILLGLLGFILVRLALWGSHGGLRAVRAGRSDPRTASLVRDIHISPPQDAAPLTARVKINLDKPAARVSSRYLSFSIEINLSTLALRPPLSITVKVILWKPVESCSIWADVLPLPS